MPADNRRDYDYIGQFNFSVEIENVTAGRFKSVDGLDSETEIIEYQDGDDMLLRKRPGRTKYSNIILKRGYADKGMLELWEWRKKVMDGVVERKSGSVILCDDTNEPICRYNFFEAWPCKWKGFTLDGKGTDAMVEEMEICVERIERETS